MTEQGWGDRLRAIHRAKKMKGLSRGRKVKALSAKQKSKLAWRAKRKRELWDWLISWGPYPTCELCGVQILAFSDCELDHKRCLGTRGDGDTDENTHLVHTLGNRAKGSVELSKYLELPLDQRRRNCGIA